MLGSSLLVSAGMAASYVAVTLVLPAESAAVPVPSDPLE